MRARPTLLATLVALALTAGAAEAARPVPAFRPFTGSPLRLAAGATASSVATCPLGVLGAPASIVGYVYPDDDQYYTLIDPTETACSGAGGALVIAGHIVAEFQYAYGTPVRVGIVQADVSDPECPVPMPGAYLCPPIDYMLESPAGGVYDVSLPLGGGCAITGPAFLEITFTEWGPWWEVPGLVLTASCEPCVSYNYYPGDHYDLCTFGFDGNPVMYADAMVNGVVPARTRTWGALKSVYR